ncbi:hypothetical protein ROLI_036430 [Roseobacter fucihabitans]|uniref:Uncharacterized protein n=2 Tax=Roseobacter fucihabitans TaxID=1537242 RepID=A0ABZ2BZC5_9RHOB|nr:Cyclic di-GMP phosphodiesterase Gmr [Roseobacter litoralis]
MHLNAHTSIVDSIDRLVDAFTLPAFAMGCDHYVFSANAAANTLLIGDADTCLIGHSASSLLAPGQSFDDFEIDHGATPRQDAQTVDLLCGQSGLGVFSVSGLKDESGVLFGYFCQAMPSQITSGDPRNRPSSPLQKEKEGEFARPGATGGRVEQAPVDEDDTRWKTAVLSANHAVWDHDFEKDQHYVSETWRALRGLAPDDPIPTSSEAWLETIHPQDLDHIKTQLGRLDARETDIVDYKFRQKHVKGHWVWFLSCGRVVRRDAQGLPARIIGTDTDITDIKTVELERHRMADRLDTAMEAAGMGRWEFDIGANYAFWDDRMLELFEITDGINIRSSTEWGQYIHPGDRDKTLTLAAECLKSGEDIACDYRHLRKDGTVRHIRTRGKYVEDEMHGPRYYGVNFDVTHDYARAEELEVARARLEYESRHDALTGLANRRYLDDVFTKNADHSEGSMQKRAILHFDIDHFKQINDTLGHDAGDATLRHAAGVLKANVPEEALVARVGGDEFVALLFCPPDICQLEQIARNIIRAMSRPFYYGSQQCNTGTSIGIAVAQGSDALNNDLFINADLALYAAKKAGRGRFRFFTQEMKTEARRRKNSFDALLAGFDNGEITCHYQPQFDANTLELTGLEALVRWESRAYGLLMPDEFLSTAEDMGLVAHFDELVLRKTLNDLYKWEAEGLEIPRVSVNVSSHRLNDPTLIERLKPLNLPRGKLSFELLESAFLDSKNEIIEQNLIQIEKMGIDIEIDDFGSGHASIVSLLHIAPKRLKIDRSLIEPIVVSQRQRDLIKTIIGIGKMLEVKVVAEGVETLDHVRVLQEIGCCYLQGYGLARPMDAKGIGNFIREMNTNEGRLATG